MQLFLDCDGVLADFDRRATEILGYAPRDFEGSNGEKDMWDRLYATPDFFYSLEPMIDAFELYEAVAHLNPVILTGKPRGDWAIDQKLRWRRKYFPHVPMIVCPSKDKFLYAKPGDILIDDWLKHRPTWENGGGIWIHHTSAADSILQLKTLGIYGVL